jgi:hypothetical protein
MLADCGWLPKPSVLQWARCRTTSLTLPPASHQAALDAGNAVLLNPQPHVYEDKESVDHAMVQQHDPLGGKAFASDALTKVRACRWPDAPAGMQGSNSGSARPALAARDGQGGAWPLFCTFAQSSAPPLPPPPPLACRSRATCR